MSATHGSAVPLRRLIGCAFALVLVISSVFAATASAKPVPVKETYLAIGDSLAFGYSQQLFNENETLGEPASAFEHGYANDYLALHQPKTNGIQLVNVGCPGETTDSLIGNGALAGAFGIPGESPCAYHKAGPPLHHEYGGTKSQLESALETIAIEAATGKPVTTITFNIGANDELRQIHACEKEVGEEYAKEGKSKYGATPESAVKTCLEAHVPELFKHILTNIGDSLYAIRNGATFGGVNYTGKIVVQGGYDPYGNVYGTGELLSGSTTLASILNKEEAKLTEEKFGACYANPEPTFNPLNSHEPGRLQKWTNMANTTEFEGKKNGPDIHPTPSGYKQLAKIMRTICG